MKNEECQNWWSTYSAFCTIAHTHTHQHARKLAARIENTLQFRMERLKLTIELNEILRQQSNYNFVFWANQRECVRAQGEWERESRLKVHLAQVQYPIIIFGEACASHVDDGNALHHIAFTHTCGRYNSNNSNNTANNSACTSKKTALLAPNNINVKRRRRRQRRWLYHQYVMQKRKTHWIFHCG